MKTSGSTESTTRPGKSGVEVGGDRVETLTSKLRMSSLTDSSTSAAQIMVEFDGVDAGNSAVGKSVKKLSKSRKIVKKSEKPQKPKNLQRPLVQRNVYRSTNPLAIKYEELKSSDSFLNSFC